MSAPVQLPLRQRARKAFGAAGTAFVGAVALALATEIPKTQAGWLAMAGAAAGVAAAAWIATFNIRNAGAGNGSDPVVPAQRTHRMP
jgi:hypothetical protein